MKKLLALFAVILAMGCAHTPEDRVQTIQDASIILRNVARGAAAVAVDENPANKKHVQLAVATLDTFLTGEDYTPDALVKALEPVLKEVRDVKVNLAINTAIDLYDVLYGRHVRRKVQSDETARLFLTALRDGAKQAL
jgi:hypothetical protein